VEPSGAPWYIVEPHGVFGISREKNKKMLFNSFSSNNQGGAPGAPGAPQKHSLLMEIRKNCTWCHGTGKFTNNYGTFDCPDCEVNHLLKLALQMEEGRIYKVDDENRELIYKMFTWFRYPSAVNRWQIEFIGEDRVRRIDYQIFNS
jgi:predicted RNA-binding Zn-ribbon protein involved in translation (DUF1610 family)